MNFLIKYGLGIIYTLAGVVGALLLITLLYHFNIVNDQIFSFLKLLVILSSAFINSFILGRKADKKGYLEGTKFGLIIIILMFIPTILSANFKVKLLIYYLVIMITTILGSMIGISKKRN